MSDQSNLDCSLSIHTIQNKSSKYSSNFFRTLNEDFPQKKYVPREKDQDRTVVHFGQRKLFLSEVEFLTNVSNSLPNKTNKKIVLIYAGAAPGNHIDLLSSMFPFIQFVLIDPARFAIEPKEEKIRINREFFTDELSLDLRHEFNDYIRLFVSDIRRAGPGLGLDDSTIETEVLDDMRSQEVWYHNLKPFRSLLKFRPPYVENRQIDKTSIDYLNGDIYFQIWPPGSSSETRLYVGENAEKKSYDCIKYENQMFRFNTVERVECYKHNVQVPGLDHCYDCRSEVYVFEEYIKSFEKIKSLSKTNLTLLSVKEYVEKLNEHLSANKKKINITYNKNEYQVNFLDIEYGKKIKEVCNDKTKSTGGDFGYKKWNNFKNGFKFNFDNTKHKKDSVKRLNTNTAKSLNTRQRSKSPETLKRERKERFKEKY